MANPTARTIGILSLVLFAVGFLAYRYFAPLSGPANGAEGASSVQKQSKISEVKNNSGQPPTASDVRSRIVALLAAGYKAPSPDQPDKTFATWLTQHDRRKVLGKNAELIARMNLPPAKEGRFDDLLVAKYYMMSDIKDAAQKEGAKLSADDVEALRTGLAEGINADLRTLLGDAEYAKYDELKSVISYRDRLVPEGIGGYAAELGAPLSKDQASSLAQVMYDVNKKYSTDPESGRYVDPGTGLTAPQLAVVEQSRSQISTAQYEALVKYYREQNVAANAAHANRPTP